MPNTFKTGKSYSGSERGYSMLKLRFGRNSLVQFSGRTLSFLSVPAVFGQSGNGPIAGFASAPSSAIIPKPKIMLQVISPELCTVGVEASRFRAVGSLLRGGNTEVKKLTNEVLALRPPSASEQVRFA